MTTIQQYHDARREGIGSVVHTLTKKVISFNIRLSLQRLDNCTNVVKDKVLAAWKKEY